MEAENLDAQIDEIKKKIKERKKMITYKLKECFHIQRAVQELEMLEDRVRASHKRDTELTKSVLNLREKLTDLSFAVENVNISEAFRHKIVKTNLENHSLVYNQDEVIKSNYKLREFYENTEIVKAILNKIEVLEEKKQRFSIIRNTLMQEDADSRTDLRAVEEEHLSHILNLVENAEYISDMESELSEIQGSYLQIDNELEALRKEEKQLKEELSQLRPTERRSAVDVQLATMGQLYDVILQTNKIDLNRSEQVSTSLPIAKDEHLIEDVFCQPQPTTTPKRKVRFAAEHKTASAEVTSTHNESQRSIVSDIFYSQPSPLEVVDLVTPVLEMKNQVKNSPIKILEQISIKHTARGVEMKKIDSNFASAKTPQRKTPQRKPPTVEKAILKIPKTNTAVVQADSIKSVPNTPSSLKSLLPLESDSDTNDGARKPKSSADFEHFFSENFAAKGAEDNQFMNFNFDTSPKADDMKFSDTENFFNPNDDHSFNFGLDPNEDIIKTSAFDL